MAKRTQDRLKGMHGRIQEFKIMHTGSEAVWITDFKPESISVTEDQKVITTEWNDGQEIEEILGSSR